MYKVSMSDGRPLDSQRLSNFLDVVLGIKEDSAEGRLIPHLHSNQELALLLAQALEDVLPVLTPIEEYVIRLRFGLGRDVHTQKATAELFNRSTSNIRQFERRALQKLRHPPLSTFISRCLEEAFQRLSQVNTLSAELTYVIETVKKLTPHLIAHLKEHEDDLEKIHPRVVEHLIAEFFASWGFNDVRLVGTNSRTSADIYAANVVNPLGVEHRYFIEVKRWKRKVGIGVINQVLGAMTGERDQFGWHAAMIVTVAGFTNFEKWDREQLKLKGLELKDKEDLLRWLKAYKENEGGLWLPEPLTLM